MMSEYLKYANVFKALSDPTRLKIIEMVSCGPMCACDILAKVDIVQSTLSYHMKILIENELVKSRPEGSWTWYSVNEEKLIEISSFLRIITSDTEVCICKKGNINIGTTNNVCQCVKERRS